MKSFNEYLTEKTRTDPSEEFFRLKARRRNLNKERKARNLPNDSPYYAARAQRLIGGEEAATEMRTNRGSVHMDVMLKKPEMLRGFEGTRKALARRNRNVQEKNQNELGEAKKDHSMNPLYGTDKDPRLDVTVPYKTSVSDPAYYDVMKKSIASDTDTNHNSTNIKTGERSVRRHPNAEKLPVNTHNVILPLKDIAKQMGIDGPSAQTRTSEIALRALEKLRAGLASDPNLQRIYKDNLHGEPRPEKPK